MRYLILEYKFIKYTDLFLEYAFNLYGVNSGMVYGTNRIAERNNQASIRIIFK